jgi:hypothetical protein
VRQRPGRAAREQPHRFEAALIDIRHSPTRLDHSTERGSRWRSFSWFAWHRHEDRDANLYDDDTAERTILEFVCAVLMPL